MRRGILLILLSAGIFTSCERTVDTPVDVDLSKPYLHDLQIFPDSFNTDTILVNGQADPQDLITLSFDCLVIVDKAAGTPPPTIRYSLTLPSEGRLYAEGNLTDNGASPDISAGDGIYAGKISFSIRREDIGNFQVIVEGYQDPTSLSNTVLRQIRVSRTNRRPTISDLSAPDSVNLPPPGAVALIAMSVAAADSDGPGDISDVFFRSLDSSDPTARIHLYDDGLRNGLSGDSVANDGVYSVIIALSDTNTAATYRFLFQAVDRSGFTSDSLLHSLTVVGP